MNKIILCLISSLALSGCVSIVQIGKLNMISDRNIDSKTNYVMLSSYMGTTDWELKQSKAESLEDAVDDIVKNTPGGEFLKNVKVYMINGKYYAVEGDIWGLEVQNFRGWKIGDAVQWIVIGKKVTGVITALKDSEYATVKPDGKETVKDVEYDRLQKISSSKE